MDAPDSDPPPPTPPSASPSSSEARSPADDPYHRLNYRRLIAWPQRIEREWPFLHQELDGAPRRAVIDLGCGTGEHARFLAAQGFYTVGVDRSGAQIEAARAYERESGDDGPVFLLGEMAELAALTPECFGAALCLGNVLPSIDDEELPRVLAALAKRLVVGGRVVIQVLNYERIRKQGLRYLPLNFRRDSDDEPGEIVFLRLMTPDGDKHIRFNPTTLLLRPGEQPPVSVVAANEARLRAWRWEELEPHLTAAGFGVFSLFGDMAFGDFEPERSSDLVIVAVALHGSES